MIDRFPWLPPEFKFLARDASGQWYAYTHRPIMGHGPIWKQTISGSRWRHVGRDLAALCFDLVPSVYEPIYRAIASPWDQSLLERFISPPEKSS